MVRVCNNISDNTGGHSCVLVSVLNFGVEGSRVINDNRTLRPINSARVKDLLASTRHGQDVIRYSRETVLVIMVDKESVDETSLSRDLRNDMPLFRFKPDARDRTMRLIDGNHRREMMLTCTVNSRIKLDSLERELKEGEEISAAERLKKMKEVQDLRKGLSRVGRWGALIIYKREYAMLFMQTSSHFTLRVE